MVKFRHNKKKNSAFLYEALVLELTKAILRKDDGSTLDKKKLLSEQNKLVRKMNKLLSEKSFNNFVPNYKSLATIYQIFNQRNSIKTKVLLENQIIKGMIVSEGTDKKQMVPIDNLVYKTFTKRFNATYSSELLKEQKELLSKFISSFVDNGVHLKLYLNEEIARLKSDLKSSLIMEEFVSDSEMTNKIKVLVKLLEEYKTQEPKKEMVEQVIKVQSLVHEIKSNGVN